MTFFIRRVTDTSILSTAKVLPVLTMQLIDDGRYDFRKFHEAIQNAEITFSMLDTSTGAYIIANQPAFIKKIGTCDCIDKYAICYQFIKREVSVPGNFIGKFTIKFGDDIKNDNYTYPSGTLVMPIKDDLHIEIR